MRPRHVIHLAAGGTVLYTWDRTHYTPVAGYELPDGDPAPLVGYLRQTPAAVIAILVDVLEEEHTRETIARLGRRDQDALLARKLARIFPRTPYRTAIVQGRLPGDAQTSRVLLSGLTKADHLAALQSLLAESRLPVANVCSPALLSRHLVQKLRPGNPADATLLASRQRDGSLRLTFFRRGNLAGSRLLRRSLAAPPGDIPRLVRQLEESVRYFDAAFAPGSGNPVDVILLLEPGASATSGGSGHEGFRLSVPEPAEIARLLRLGCPLEPGNANQLYVELLRRHAPAGNFAPAADRRYFHLHQARTFGKAACLALATAALLGAALNGVAVIELAQQTADVRTSIDDLNAQLDAGLGREPATGADPLEMQRIARSWQLLLAHAVEPGDILGFVSDAVGKQPLVQLDGIEWSPVAALPGAAASGDVEPDAAAVEGGEPASPGNDAGLPGQEQRVRITIRGRVEPFDGYYPQAFAEVRTLMRALRSDPRVIRVVARKEPLDVSPRSTLSGELSPAGRTGTAEFTIDVLLRVGHAPA